jgi:predicted chitinase
MDQTLHDWTPVLGRPLASPGKLWPSWSQHGGMAPGMRGTVVPGPLRAGAGPEAVMQYPPATRTMQQMMEPMPFRITAPLLRRIFPSTTQAAAEKNADVLTTFMTRYEIDTVKRMAAFFGQIGLESEQLRRSEENLIYSSEERLLEVSPKKLPRQTIADYVRAPERLANRVYASMGGNSDEASGDGFRYRGRGLIQLTLKDNYKALPRTQRWMLWLIQTSWPSRFMQHGLRAGMGMKISSIVLLMSVILIDSPF